MPPSNSENLLRTRLSPLREIARRILGRSAENPTDAQLQQVLNTNSPVRLPELPGSQLTFSPGEATVRAWPRALDTMDVAESGGYQRAWDPEYRSWDPARSLVEQTRLALQPGADQRIDTLSTTNWGNLSPVRHAENVQEIRDTDRDISYVPRNRRDQNMESLLVAEQGYPQFGSYRAYSDPVNVPYQVIGFTGLGPSEHDVNGHFPGGPHHTRMSLITHGGRIGQANLDELQSDFFSAGVRDPERVRELDAQIYALHEQKDALARELREEGREGRSWREQSPRYHAITSEWQSVKDEIRRLQAESDKSSTGVSDYGPLRSIWPRVLLNDAVLRAIDTPEANFFTWSPPSVHRNLYGIAPGEPEDNMYRNMYERVVPRAAEQLHRRLGAPYVSETIPGDPSRLSDSSKYGGWENGQSDLNFQGFRITDELRRAAEGVNRLVDDPRPSGFSLPLYAEGGGVA
jgi:hypothetical protein